MNLWGGDDLDTVGIRFSGFGGQGLISASIILAEAASTYESRHVLQRDDKYKREAYGLYVVQTQTYGAGVRGGATRAEVKISKKKINYPEIEKPDILVIMSEEAFVKYADQVKPSTLIIIDPDVVKSRPDVEYCEIPATRTAMELGNKIVANMVMLGAIVAMSHVVHLDSVKKAVKDLLPEKTYELNHKALDKGHELGKTVCEQGFEMEWSRAPWS